MVKDINLVERIFAKQKPDGYWYEPENFYVYTKYKGTIWSMILLVELEANLKDPRIKKTCEFIFTCSQHRESSDFAFHGTSEKGGESDCIIPCLTGNMVWGLVKFGYWNDPRLQKGIKWITTCQRFDDGECKAPKGFPYRSEPCWGKHMCMIGVAKILRVLSEIHPQMRNTSVQHKIDQGIAYVLKH